MRLVDAALIHQILDKAAHGVVGEGRDHGGVQTKTAFQPARTLYSPPPSQTSNERVV